MSEGKADFTAGKIILAMLPAVTAFVGVVYGAHLNGVASKDASQYSKLQEARIAAYVDFTNARRLVVRNPNDANAEMIAEQSSIRIGIYGDEAVVHSIAENWRAGGLTKPCAPKLTGDAVVYENMRRDVFGAMPNSQIKNDLVEIIYGCRIA